ncbi:MAG: hypothetical protein Q7S53_01125 [bacterium]|nr:hypothetical protein [bacterium]
MKVKMILKNDKGTAILWTMMLVFLFFMVTSSMVVVSLSTIRQSSEINASIDAYLAAESGLDIVQEKIDSSTASTSGHFGVNPNDETNYQTLKTPGYSYNIVKKGELFNGVPCPAPYSYCYTVEGQVGSISREYVGMWKEKSSSRKAGLDLSKDAGASIALGTQTVPFSWEYLYIKKNAIASNPFFSTDSGGTQNESIYNNEASKINYFKVSGNINFNNPALHRSKGTYTFGLTDDNSFLRVWVNNYSRCNSNPYSGTDNASIAFGIPATAGDSAAPSSYAPVHCIYLNKNNHTQQVNNFKFEIIYEGHDAPNKSKYILKIKDAVTGECIGSDIRDDFQDTLTLATLKMFFHHPSGIDFGRSIDADGNPYYEQENDSNTSGLIDYKNIYFEYDVKEATSIMVPNLALTYSGAFWNGYSDYQDRQLTASFVLDNTGAGTGYNAKVTDASLHSGVYITTPMPYSLGTAGTIAPGYHQAFNMKFRIPSGTTTFKGTLYVSVEDSDGTVHDYSLPFEPTFTASGGGGGGPQP